MCEACSIESNQTPQDMAYTPGKPFPTHHAQNASDYLNAALSAERWIAAFEHKTPEGIFWQQDASQPIDLSLYSGSAGVAYFYLKLTEVTGNAEFAEKARCGLSYAAAHWRDLLLPEQAAFQDNREGAPGVHLGAHMGVGGVGLALIEGAKTFAESRDAEKYRRAARAIGRFYTDESAQQGENGPYWTGSPALLMDGGIMLFLIALYETFGDQQLLEFIKAAGAQYLRWGAESPRGGVDFNGAGIETPFDWPNFAFGSAGSGYLLAHLFRITGDARYLEVARRCADFLDAVAVPQKRGKLIPHKLGGDDEFTVFYLGYCHGIAGTLRFPTLMGDPRQRYSLGNDGQSTRRRSRSARRTRAYVGRPLEYRMLLLRSRRHGAYILGSLLHRWVAALARVRHTLRRYIVGLDENARRRVGLLAFRMGASAPRRALAAHRFLRRRSWHRIHVARTVHA